MSLSRIDLSGVTWFTSSHSGPNGGQCVEVGRGLPGLVPVRDSKDPDGPVLTLSPAAWRSFLAAVTTGRMAR
jgi:hypothetical protein